MKMFKKVISMALALCMLMIPITAKAAGGIQINNGVCTITVYGDSGDSVDIYYDVRNSTENPTITSDGSGNTGISPVTKQFDATGTATISFNVNPGKSVDYYYEIVETGKTGFGTDTYVGSTPSPTPTDTVAPTDTATPTATPVLMGNLLGAVNPTTGFGFDGNEPKDCIITVPNTTTVDYTSYLVIPTPTSSPAPTVYLEVDSGSTSYASITGNVLKPLEETVLKGKKVTVTATYDDTASGGSKLKDTTELSIYGQLKPNSSLKVEDNVKSYREYTTGDTLKLTDLDVYAYMITKDGDTDYKLVNLVKDAGADLTAACFSYQPKLGTKLTKDITSVKITLTYNGETAEGTIPVTVSDSSGIKVDTKSGMVGDVIDLRQQITPIEDRKDTVTTITLKDSNITGPDASGKYTLVKEGTATYEVKKYDGTAVTGTVNISARVDKLYIDKEPTKMIYQEGETINLTGLVVSADVYTDTTQTQPTKRILDNTKDISCTPSWATPLTIGDDKQQLRIYYTLDPTKYADVTTLLTVDLLANLDAPDIVNVSGSKTDSSRTVTLSCSNANAKIYYTTDGSDPFDANKRIEYKAPFEIKATTTLRAMAEGYPTGSSSPVRSKETSMKIVVGEKYGTVYNCRTSVNVRSGPGTNYSKIGVAKKGTVYSITGESGNWYQIDYNGTTGYISKSYMKVTTTGGDLTGTGTIVNCKHKINVRKGPGTGYKKIGSAYLGETYNLLALDHDSQGRDWYMVQYGTTTGYIYGKYIKTSATPTPITSKNVKVSNCSQWVNVRSGPSTSYAKVGRAYLGDVYALEDWYGGNGFAKVTYVNKVTGEVRAASYISTKYLTPSN